MNQSEAPFCGCCEFGDHNGPCTCPDARYKDCCHPQYHFRGVETNRRLMVELAGPAECAAILEVSHARFSVLSRASDFPRPVARLRCGAVYIADEIRDYHATRNRRRGRPKRECA